MHDSVSQFIHRRSISSLDSCLCGRQSFLPRLPPLWRAARGRLTFEDCVGDLLDTRDRFTVCDKLTDLGE